LRPDRSRSKNARADSGRFATSRTTGRIRARRPGPGSSHERGEPMELRRKPVAVGPPLIRRHREEPGHERLDLGSEPRLALASGLVGECRATEGGAAEKDVEGLLLARAR